MLDRRCGLYGRVGRPLGAFIGARLLRIIGIRFQVAPLFIGGNASGGLAGFNTAAGQQQGKQAGSSNAQWQGALDGGHPCQCGPSRVFGKGAIAGMHSQLRAWPKPAKAPPWDSGHEQQGGRRGR